MSQSRGTLILCLCFTIMSLYMITQTSALLNLRLGKSKMNESHHKWKKGHHDWKNKSQGDGSSWNKKWDFSHWHEYFNESKNGTNATSGGSSGGNAKGGPPPEIMANGTGVNGTMDLDNIPNPVESIKFLLRDRKGQAWVEIPINGTVPSQWQEDQPVKIVIHGYSDKADTFCNQSDHTKIFKQSNLYDVASTYGKTNETLNVILMDWAAFAGGAKQNYEMVMGHVPMVGDILAGFLMDLEKEGHIKNFSCGLHLIGYCMGAHVAGVAGKIVTEITGGAKVERITGLDPSNAGFDDADGKKMKDDELALTKDDAGFVDIIHCNMGQAADDAEAMKKGRLGSMVQAGHADFYPNGGETQKDCKPEEDGPDTFCSTKKCPQYFAKSIKEDFLACLCDDYEEFGKGNCECTEKDGVLMGDKVANTAAGRYYLAIPKN